MILKQQVNEAEYIGDITENKVGIDVKNIDFIATLLTSNLYSKPFASFLRETISNAYDSHIEAGTKEHIILLLEKGNNYDTMRVSIRDFGVGISPERFEQIYRNIGSSTKRESNDFIGCFGIGRFSCLSCADVANVTSYYNGMKYSYIMYKNNGGINIDKLHQERGDFKNGLEVSVEVEYDRSTVEHAIRGLCLFDNLYIENKVPDYRIKSIVDYFNNRTILDQGDYYVIQGMALEWGQNYVGLGKVLYPINKSELQGMNTSGIIIKVPVGSVDITPNRETLQFSKRTVDIINTKIKKIKEYWSDEAAKALNDTDLITFYKFATQSEFDVGDTVVSQSDIALDSSLIKIDGEDVPRRYDEFLSRLKYATIPRNNVYKIISSSGSKRYLSFRAIFESHMYAALKVDTVTKNTTISYFRDNYKDCVVFGYSNIRDLGLALCISLNGALYGIDKSLLEICVNFTLKHFKFLELSNANVPQEYIDAIKEAERNKKIATDVQHETVREFTPYCYRQFDLKTWLESRPKSIPFVVYAANSKDENELYRHVAGVLDYYYKSDHWKHPVMITVKSSMLPLLKDRKKFVHITDFLYLRNNFWTKVITADIIYQSYFTDEESSWKMALMNLPLWKEFRDKYATQLRCISELKELPVYEDIRTLYENNKWLNYHDISYFKLTDDDKRIINETCDLKHKEDDMINAMLYKKYGKNNKLGITLPKSFIYKYIKNECIQK